MKEYKIASIPGDGIGKEVVPEGLKVLKDAAEKHQFKINFTEYDFASCDYYEKHGKMLPDDWKEKLVKRRYKNLVSEEIYLHLHEDEIEFSNPIFQEIYAELIHQLNQSKQIDFKKLLKTQDQITNASDSRENMGELEKKIIDKIK